MIALRSLIFNIAFFGSLISVILAVWVLLPFPRRLMQKAFQSWMRCVMWMMRVFLNLTCEVRGRENLPRGGVILASKHQSAWDTGFFYLMVDDPAYVLKKELLSVPLYGWYLRKVKMIAVDRKAGASALKVLLRKTGEALKGERAVIIFPEGTRMAPGTRRAYHPGVAALYTSTGAPVVPVAVNSGVFWPRRSFNKQAGRIVVEFLPPMPENLDRRAFLAELEARIEGATERLCEEAYAAIPDTAKRS